MEITPLTHLLQVSDKSCRKPRNTLKTQLHFDCASETSKGSESLGEVEDYPSVLEEKNAYVASHQISFLSVSLPKGHVARGHPFKFDLYILFLRTMAEVLSISMEPGFLGPSGNEHLRTLLVLHNKATHRVRQCPRCQGFL